VVIKDVMLTAGIGGWGTGVFLRTMTKELGWSRGATSFVALVRSVMPVIVAPFLGRFVDRKHGPRTIVAVGAVAAGLSLMLVSQVRELWQFYLFFGVMWGAASVSMGGALVGPAVISKWFIRMRGRAIALGNMGYSAGGVVVVPMVAFFLSAFGWRNAWVLTGLVVMGVVAPLAFFFMWRRPEDMGLRPDGDPPEAPARGDIGGPRASAASEERSFTVREAVRQGSFWLMIATVSFATFANPPILFHQVAYMEDKGFSLGTAATVATVMAVFAALAKPAWGLLAERFPTRYLMTGCFSLAGLAVFLLVTGRSEIQLYAYAISHGATMGGMVTLFDITWATYFGREHLGAIRGVTTPLTTWISGVSTLLGGLAFDALGSYDLIFTVFAVFWLTAAGVALLAKPPRGAKKSAAVSAASR
ncbi:MAG: MFS transporter, partial [Chloroflexi bacterium]|nr:MFS transporter [Chloroflexota bacterium]